MNEEAYSSCRTVCLADSVKNKVEFVLCDTDASMHDAELKSDIGVILCEQAAA